jgi:hypothetical protein
MRISIRKLQGAPELAARDLDCLRQRSSLRSAPVARSQWPAVRGGLRKHRTVGRRAPLPGSGVAERVTEGYGSDAGDGDGHCVAVLAGRQLVLALAVDGRLVLLRRGWRFEAVLLQTVAKRDAGGNRAGMQSQATPDQHRAVDRAGAYSVAGVRRRWQPMEANHQDSRCCAAANRRGVVRVGNARGERWRWQQHDGHQQAGPAAPMAARGLRALRHDNPPPADRHRWGAGANQSLAPGWSGKRCD